MKKTPVISAESAELRRHAKTERQALRLEKEHHPMMAELRRRAVHHLRKQQKNQKSAANGPLPEANAERTLHELQVHQIELEMQNTELQEARNRMEALVEKYTDLYDFAPVGYFSLDEKGVIQEVNLTGTAMLGVERSRLINRHMSCFVDAASQPDFLAFLKRVFGGSGQEVCDLAMVREDDASFWARFHGTVALAAGDPRTWCRVSVADITLFKQAEEALRGSEERYRTLFNSMDEGFCIIEMIFDKNKKPVDFRFLEVNPAFEKQTGLKDARGQRMRALAPQHEQHWFNIYGKVALTGEAIRFEDQAAALHRWFEVHAFPVEVPAGRRVGIVFNDITERKKAEATLRESQKQFHTLAEAMPQLAWMAQPDGFITWYNQRWYEYTGTTPKQMAGWGWQSVHDPEMLPQVLKRWKASLATGQPFDMAFPLRGADGGFRRFLTRGVPQKDKQGRVLQWFGTNTDIEDQQRAAETQRRAEVLAASNRKLEKEIVRRVAGEAALQQSEKELSQSLVNARRQQEELRLLTHEVLSAQEEERKRISRELHDVIAQTLAGINVRLAALKKPAAFKTTDLERNITKTQQLVEQSVDIVHRFARELRPAVLDDLGLIPALHTCLKDFTTRTGIRTHLTAFAGVEQLDAARRTVFFRVAQEALMNVSRHAHASRVEITLKKLPDGFGLTIADDGKSFSVEKTVLANRGQRLGLLGMRERLEMVGGKFNVESAPGQGTTIEAQIPFSKKNRGGRK